MKKSIVIPCYNEESYIDKLSDSLVFQCESLKLDYEIINNEINFIIFSLNNIGCDGDFAISNCNNVNINALSLIDSCGND